MVYIGYYYRLASVSLFISNHVGRSRVHVQPRPALSQTATGQIDLPVIITEQGVYVPWSSRCGSRAVTHGVSRVHAGPAAWGYQERAVSKHTFCYRRVPSGYTPLNTNYTVHVWWGFTGEKFSFLKVSKPKCLFLPLSWYIWKPF